MTNKSTKTHGNEFNDTRFHKEIIRAWDAAIQQVEELAL